MALRKSLKNLVFTSGVDTKQDSKSNSEIDLLALENAKFQKVGAIDKAYGSTKLRSKDTNNNNITGFQSLYTFKNELLAVATGQLYSYAQAQNKWIPKNQLRSASVEVNTIVANSYEQTKSDVALLNGVLVYAWEDSRGGVRYSIVDQATGVFYVADQELDSAGSEPRCVPIGQRIFIFYGDSTDLKYKSVLVSQPTAALGSGTTLSGLINANHVYDIVPLGDIAVFAGESNTANYGRIATIDSSGASITVIEDADVDIDNCVSITAYDLTIFVVWHKASPSTGIGGVVYNIVLTEQVAPANIATSNSANVGRITSVRSSSTANEITIFWDYESDPAKPHYDVIQTCTLDNTGTASSVSTLKRGITLASKPFLSTNDLIYFSVVHVSTFQSTMFLLNSSGQVVCRYSVGTSYADRDFNRPPNVAITSSGKILVPFLQDLNSEDRNNLSVAELDFNEQNIFTNAEINKNQHLVGGIVNIYDGNNAYEQGFNLFPENLERTNTYTTGGAMSDGTRQYSAVYRWTDNQGNIHRSAPSIPVTFTLSGGVNTQVSVISVPELRLTEKENVFVDLYRTINNGSIFYLSTSSASVKTGNNSLLVDAISDADIVSNEILYTDGGILDNIAAPSCDLITTHQNRLFLAGLENKNRVVYSKIVREGQGIAFNEALEIFADPKGGKITQIDSLDDKLIIAKENSLYYVTGEGPNDAGVDSTYTEPELISSDVGCSEPKSMVRGPDGLYFKSNKGIYRLSRNLVVGYIGAPVEDFNDSQIVSAQLLADVNEIRFYTDGGNTLVYNYFFKTWAVHTQETSVDAVLWNNLPVFVDTSDIVRQEDQSTWRVDTAFRSMKISTGWIRMAGYQGFQRVYRAMVLGKFYNNHRLRIKVFTDYSDTVVQQREFVTGTLLNADNYGTGTYGEGTPYGTDDNGVYQFTVHMKQQKCQAIRFEIEDITDNTEPASNVGRALSITGLALQIGVKSGLNKLREGKSL